jgi:hypothetical protein
MEKHLDDFLLRYFSEEVFVSGLVVVAEERVGGELVEEVQD